MSLIESNERLVSALHRIHDANTGVTFSNKNNDFKVMVRNDPDGGVGHFMTFEVVIIAEDNNAILRKCLDHFVDTVGFEDDGGQEFIVGSFEVDKRVGSGEDDVEDLKEMLNNLYETSYCQCGQRFIHDGQDMCVFCDMTATPEKLAPFDCAVCMETGHDFHSTKMKCCGNKLHVLCDDQWFRKGNKTCAFCRAELPKREHDTTGGFLDRLVSNIAGEVERRLNGEVSEEEVE